MKTWTLRTVLRSTALGLLMIGTMTCQTFRQLELQSTQFLFSAQQEAELGAAFAEQIEEDIELVTDPFIQAWIDEVGYALVETSPPTPQQFTFRVTTSEQVNAFAIPGGYCYINAGLIMLAENEAEVVAVVGHEINHVTTRHGMRSLQRAIGFDLAVQAAGSDPGSRAIAELASSAGGMLAMRSFGREDEREADRLGVEAMYRAGWDPRAAATFFQKLYEGQQGAGARDNPFTQLLSTHPATTERIRNIEAQVAGYDLSRPLRLNSDQFQEVQARLARLAPEASDVAVEE